MNTLEGIFKYWTWEDIALFHYTKRFWKDSRRRECLLRHWNHPEHPYREGFHRNRDVITWVLESEEKEADINKALLKMGLSLRVVVRMIPPAIGSLGPVFNHAKT